MYRTILIESADRSGSSMNLSLQVPVSPFDVPGDRWKVRVAGGGDSFMVEDMFKDLKVSVDCDEGLCRDGDKPGSRRVPAKIDQICTMDDSNVTNELSIRPSNTLVLVPESCPFFLRPPSQSCVGVC